IRRDGKRDGKSFPLQARQCLFGRDEKCDIRIQRPECSMHHCRLMVDDNNKVMVQLEPQSDTNPTLLNDQAIASMTTLADGDVFSIGSRKFRF
ncbi:uncharacterized protein MONBRDRAFT_3524, partial [Monosiga brevicollis MX1]